MFNGGTESVVINDHLIGILYASAGDRARSTAILLHGIPGAEKNVDIAYRLRDQGWHVLIVFFGGSWGSGGDYDMVAQPDQALQVLDFLLRPGQKWQVDLAHIVLIGYSLGSRAAIVAAGRDQRITGVISISGIAAFDEIMLSDDFYAEAAPFLRGMNAKTLIQQWGKLGGTEDPYNVISRLDCPILIVHGTEDEIIPPYMATALHGAQPRADLALIPAADHTFTHHRMQLVEIVTDWLHKYYSD